MRQLIEPRRNHQVASFALKIIATRAAIASRLCSAALINFRAATAKRRKRFAFWFLPGLARFMQETERSVSYP
jgi:hypothetical protein